MTCSVLKVKGTVTGCFWERGIRDLCGCEWVSLAARTGGLCVIQERIPEPGVGKRQDTALRAGGDLSKKVGQT